MKKGAFLFLKIILIGFLMLVLLIPTLMIQDLIHERQARRNEAIHEIAERGGGKQTIGGPILVVPYEKHRTFMVNDKKELETTIHYAYFLPENLHITATSTNKLLRRGIFEIPVYNSQTKVSGMFKKPDFSKFEVPQKDILWDKAYLTLKISNLRGIHNTVIMDWDGKNLNFGPKFKKGNLFQSSIQTVVPALAEAKTDATFPFTVNLQLSGSQSFAFLPLGRNTEVKLESDWPHPSFQGSHIPVDRKVEENGFTAYWKIPETGRNLPAQWKDDEIQKHYLSQLISSVDLILPVDTYQFSMRSVKYANLFIFLTFVAFFLFEILSKLKIHPIQYLLVGMALCLFYLLLLSLAEHLDFGLAYLIATLTTVGLITFYIARVLRKKSYALLMTAILGGLYGYLYTLLQAEDFALLMGSVGLFVILALVMFLTRKIDWYELSNFSSLQAKPPKHTAPKIPTPTTDQGV